MTFLEELYNIINKHSKLDERRQIKYICPSDYSKFANEVEELHNKEVEKEIIKFIKSI